MPAKKWHTPDPRWLKSYDKTMDNVRRTIGSYNRIAAELFRLTGEHVTGQSFRRWVLERSIPLKWACSTIDLMNEHGEEVDVLDFYPWLQDYVGEDFLR